LTAQAALKSAEANHIEAVAQRERAERHLYAARISLAENALRQDDSQTAGGILDKCLPEPGRPDLRGFEWHYLEHWRRPEVAVMEAASADPALAVAASPDGRFVAVGGGGISSSSDPLQDGRPASLLVFDAHDGRPIHTLAGHWGAVEAGAVTFSPDGTRLASSGYDGYVLIRDTASWKLLRTLHAGRPGYVYGLAWSPDGLRLASGGWGGRVSVWGPRSGRKVATVGVESSSVAWSPDGRRLATGSAVFRANGGSYDLHGGEMGSLSKVHFWDPESGRASWPPLECRERVHSLAWSSDDRRLVAGFSLWDTTTSKPALAKQIEAAQLDSGFAFSPDGRRLATNADNNTIRIFDTESGKEQVRFVNASGKAVGLAFTPDGRRLYAGNGGAAGSRRSTRRTIPTGPPCLPRARSAGLRWNPEASRSARSSGSTTRPWNRAT
jgi:WD40 repeat protein